MPFMFPFFTLVTRRPVPDAVVITASTVPVLMVTFVGVGVPGLVEMGGSKSCAV